MSLSVLVIEDEAILARSIKKTLEREGYQVFHETSAEAGWETLKRTGPDLLLLDLRLPGMGGIEFLRTIREQGHEMPAIIMTAHGSVRNAVEAMRLGAYDYITKPLDLEELSLVVGRALEHARISHELTYYRERDRRGPTQGLLIGQSPAMRKVQEQIERIARMERSTGGGGPTVLLRGETGTGKGMAARAIHDLSPRASSPFIDVNCTALPDTLLESELFGFEKGAFTDAKTSKRGLFEAADKGTIFLDEIGHLNLSAQAKLLKVIEDKKFRRLGSTAERTVDVRIVTATNRDLEAACSTGAFREDLYHRLKVITIEMPPLRARAEDILLLAEHFMRRHCQQYGIPHKKLSPKAREVLLGYTWPGNVRELANEIEKAVLLETGNEIALDHLSDGGRKGARRTGVFSEGAAGVEVSLPEEGIPFETIERQIIVKALEQSGWNVTQAARMLSLSRDTIRYRIEKLGITPPGEEPQRGI